MKHSIQLVTRLQDNGDGGYTMYLYNNNDELIKDHPNSSKYEMVNGKYQEVPIVLTESEIKDILNEDDPYENGYIGQETIEIEIDEKTGIAKLSKPISLHAGQ